jgi:tetracycline 7-halogenase / FADH2 O2-dependent halogenase
LARRYDLPRLPYRCKFSAGPGWALLPSAAAFVDPLFSTGFPLALLGIHRLAEALREAWGTPDLDRRLREYEAVTAREAAGAARLVGACYRAFGGFASFRALSMFYFAAASYSEMARRLGRPHLAAEFLLQDRPPFRAVFERFTSQAERRRPVDPDDAAAALEPFNVAGLCDPAKRHWYGADPEDVVRGAGRLDATPEEVRAFFARMGW